ncbi:MAG: hydantoinase B/oxoprolinase family protein [Pseudomonadales bacterium]
MTEPLNPVELAIFVSRCAGICDEMGMVLRSAACSPNIKDRLDFSCALFDAEGGMFAQAAHVPVHLGSMAFAMRDIAQSRDWHPGDELIFNDPFLGGTHLPDVTLVRPHFLEGRLMGFVVNRAHHAQIGADTPGSMPISTSIDEEGCVIAPALLQARSRPVRAMMVWLKKTLGAGTMADLAAQSSANRVGSERLAALVKEFAGDDFLFAIQQLNAYGRTMALAGIARIPEGVYGFEDVMDSDGLDAEGVKIRVEVTIAEGNVNVDFSGTSAAVAGNINCPISVTASGVYYAMRCLLPENTPACAGAFSVITLRAEPGCLINAERPSATAAGNVETSMRIVDCMFGALSTALPSEIPAASQGTMNNVAMGRVGQWDYYETLGGGVGASELGPGINAVQSHMTNTLNTPIEVLESNYPVEIVRYGIRSGSGGGGLHSGGEGLIRSYRFLEDAEVTLITERRRSQPWGLAGGAPGSNGHNTLNDRAIPDKVQLEVKALDILTVQTPGGGGWGLPPAEAANSGEEVQRS